MTHDLWFFCRHASAGAEVFGHVRFIVDIDEDADLVRRVAVWFLGAQSLEVVRSGDTSTFAQRVAPSEEQFARMREAMLLAEAQKRAEKP